MVRRLLTVITAVLLASPATASAARCGNGYVGLTFDDGPTKATAGLLDALRRHDLRATMFDIGSHAQWRPDDVQAQIDAGMWIGNHSLTHRDLTSLDPPDLRTEIDAAQTLFTAMTGQTPSLFRPPLMQTGRRVRAQERRASVTEVLATVDTRDYAGASVDEIVRAVRTVEPGGIVLMHDWPRNTTKAIPRIAAVLRRKGLCPGRIRSTARDVRTGNGRAVFHAVAVRP